MYTLSPASLLCPAFLSPRQPPFYSVSMSLIFFVLIPHTGWGQSRFTALPMENNTIIDKYYYKNKLCVSRTHNCKPPLALLWIYCKVGYSSLFLRLFMAGMLTPVLPPLECFLRWCTLAIQPPRLRMFLSALAFALRDEWYLLCIECPWVAVLLSW